MVTGQRRITKLNFVDKTEPSPWGLSEWVSAVSEKYKEK